MQWELSKQNRAFNLLAFDVLDSTQSVAKTLCSDMNTVEDTLVLADSQYQGRGRFQNAWQSVAGKDLLFTYILRPTAVIAEWTKISLVFAWVLKEALQLFLPPHKKLHLKWPNDIVYHSKKCVGILAEPDPHSNSLLIGVGINVNSDYSKNTDRCSLKDLCDRELDRDLLLSKILDLIVCYQTELKKASLNTFTWNASAAFLGQSIGFFTAKDEYRQGEFLGIDEKGFMVIKAMDSTLETIQSAYQIRLL